MKKYSIRQKKENIKKLSTVCGQILWVTIQKNKENKKIQMKLKNKEKISTKKEVLWVRKYIKTLFFMFLNGFFKNALQKKRIVCQK